jgi:hypothetical protein
MPGGKPPAMLSVLRITMAAGRLSIPSKTLEIQSSSVNSQLRGGSLNPSLGINRPCHYGAPPPQEDEA